MSDVKAKMHQNQFRLGLYPRPPEELTSLPDPLLDLRGSTFKGREERETGGVGKTRPGLGKRKSGNRNLLKLIPVNGSVLVEHWPVNTEVERGSTCFV